jgi:hypothetical protein
MSDRVYTTFIDNVSIGTAVQDIFSLKAGTGGGIEIHHIMLTAGGVSAAAEIRVRLKRLTGTVASGSGGSTPAVTFVDSGDTKTSTATVHANDGTQATGTSATLAVWQWNVLMPLEHMPAPEDRESCGASEAIVLDLPATITATTISGFIKWSERP